LCFVRKFIKITDLDVHIQVLWQIEHSLCVCVDWVCPKYISTPVH
jgi:hypothetical protein